MSEGEALFSLQAFEPPSREENRRVSHTRGSPHREAVRSETTERGLTEPQPCMAPTRGPMLRVFSWNTAVACSVLLTTSLFSLLTRPKALGALRCGWSFWEVTLC